VDKHVGNYDYERFLLVRQKTKLQDEGLNGNGAVRVAGWKTNWPVEVKKSIFAALANNSKAKWIILSLRKVVSNT